ncbi:MAG: hypothetical protein KAS32_11755 [Candidatus Peribacteraceae bacterium]|nr:hypothetical protein [Candidatus Peribacteraceae bacterium]
MPRDKQADKWLAKKRGRAQYWQVKRFMETLRLPYKEKDKGRTTYSISVPLFGLRFRFNGIPEPEDRGWKLFLIDIDKIETTPDYFREDVMWYLIERGYMSFIRNSEVGNNERIFKKFIIDARWGEKIIKRRLELYGKSPENTYMRLRMEEFLSIPMPKILSYFPGFFDFLI